VPIWKLLPFLNPSPFQCHSFRRITRGSDPSPPPFSEGYQGGFSIKKRTTTPAFSPPRTKGLSCRAPHSYPPRFLDFLLFSLRRLPVSTHLKHRGPSSPLGQRSVQPGLTPSFHLLKPPAGGEADISVRETKDGFSVSHPHEPPLPPLVRRLPFPSRNRLPGRKRVSASPGPLS